MSDELPVPKKLTLWSRLIAGGATRRTRFHDELGQPISLGRALRNGPRALATGLARVLFGVRPERPWISYDAQVALAAILGPESDVLEFGSGMSTAWYCRHARHVVSIEDDQAWYDAIAARLKPLANVDYRFANGRAEYIRLAPERDFDLIMIDGNWRDDCAAFALRHLKAGGVIYLDNSDKQVGPGTGDVPKAVAILKEMAMHEGLPIREFTDFAPTQLFVQRGLMTGGPRS